MKKESIFIIHPETPEQENALIAFIKALKIKFEITKKNPYNADYVAKIKQSRMQVEEGKTTKLNLDEIWKGK